MQKKVRDLKFANKLLGFFILLITLVSFAVILSSCDDADITQDDIDTLQMVYNALDVESTIGHIDISVKKSKDIAYSIPSELKIILSERLVQQYHSGFLSKSAIAFVIAHEVGHCAAEVSTNPEIRQLNTTKAGEDFADWWSLLALEDLHIDHPELGISAEEGIKFFLLYPMPGTDGIHRSSADRYKMLLDKIKFWRKHDKHAPEAG